MIRKVVAGSMRSPRGAGFLPAVFFAALWIFSVLASAVEKPDVQAKLVAPASLAAGSTGSVVVVMEIGPKWHVNSHTPSDKFLIPTEVAMTATAGTLSAFRYPKDVEKRFSFSDKPLRVYEKTVRFEADLLRPEGAGGDITLRGTLSYQACNEQQCFAPAKIPLETTVTVPVAGKGR